MPTVEEQFCDLVDQLAGEPGVTTPDEPARRGFGSGSLKVDGSIFAMLSRGRLVVKLPGPRVRDLIAGAAGAPFDAGKSTPMKEWVVVTSDDPDLWLALAREALDFVRRRSSR